MKLGELWALTLVTSSALPASGGARKTPLIHPDPPRHQGQHWLLRPRDTHRAQPCDGGPLAPRKKGPRGQLGPEACVGAAEGVNRIPAA